jgi:hypothetical protein
MLSAVCLLGRLAMVMLDTASVILGVFRVCAVHRDKDNRTLKA